MVVCITCHCTSIRYWRLFSVYTLRAPFMLVTHDGTSQTCAQSCCRGHTQFQAACNIYDAVKSAILPFASFPVVDRHYFSHSLPNTLSDFEPAPNNLPEVKGLAVVNASACTEQFFFSFSSTRYFFGCCVNIYLQSPAESKWAYFLVMKSFLSLFLSHL